MDHPMDKIPFFRPIFPTKDHPMSAWIILESLEAEEEKSQELPQLRKEARLESEHFGEDFRVKSW